MAVYKVPQDVEADDKLIGPFSFRQFIYLIIVAICCGIAWGLFMLFPLLVLIPMPLILFFGALALPLKKDQPMEVYLAAIVSFHLKPRRRFWEADGIQSLVQITAPKVVVNPLVKDITIDEAQKRLSYLADISDTRGWAVRGVVSPDSNSNLSEDVFLEASEAVDVLDSSTEVAQSFDSKLNQASANRRENMIKSLQAAPVNPVVPAVSPVVQTPADPVVAPEPQAPIVSQPVAIPTPPQIQTPSTSEIAHSPDIIELANNRPDLSIQSIAHEAKRIHDREEEVLISFH